MEGEISKSQNKVADSTGLPSSAVGRLCANHRLATPVPVHHDHRLRPSIPRLGVLLFCDEHSPTLVARLVARCRRLFHLPTCTFSFWLAIALRDWPLR